MNSIFYKKEKKTQVYSKKTNKNRTKHTHGLRFAGIFGISLVNAIRQQVRTKLWSEMLLMETKLPVNWSARKRGISFAGKTVQGQSI